MGLDLTNQYVDETYQKLVQISGSNQITDGLGALITSLDVNATTATSASHALNANNSISSSYSVSATSSSYANTSTSASHALSADTSISSSYALTASYAENANVNSGSWDGQYTGSAGIQGRLSINGTQEGVVQETLEVIASTGTVTAMQLLVTGSGTKIAFQGAHVTNGLPNATLGFQFDATDVNAVKPQIYFDDNGNGSDIISEGDLNITSSLGVINIVSPLNAASITGSLQGNADTATSASYAVTASYALNAGGGAGFPFTGSAGISGSLRVHNNNGLDAQFKEDGDIVLQTGGDIDFNLVNGDNNSAVKIQKGTSSYLFGINQSPGFTGSILSALGVDEFKVTGDTALALDNTGYAGTNNISLRASDDVVLQADDRVTITSNTSTPYQGITLAAPNVRVALSETGSTSGTFALEAPGFAANTPKLLLSLGTGSYGSNPTTAIMNFTGDDAFFGAQGNFYIKNIYNGTGSITVWSENQLTLRGDTSVQIQGDYFAAPGVRIPINLRGKTYAESIQADTLGFTTTVTDIVYIDQNTRAFVEAPLQIGGGGTITVDAGSTLKILDPFGTPVVSSSYATTASYALNGEDWDGILVGNAQITGSLNVLGNADFGGAGATQTFDGYQTTFNAQTRFNNTCIVDGAFLQQASLAINTFDGDTNFGKDVQITGSLNIAQTMNLASQDPLPAGAIGDLAVSGSNLFFYNGAWTQVI